LAKGRAKKYRQESRMGRFQKNANETKAAALIVENQEPNA